jgi:hypothetical protein
LNAAVVGWRARRQARLRSGGEDGPWKAKEILIVKKIAFPAALFLSAAARLTAVLRNAEFNAHGSLCLLLPSGPTPHDVFRHPGFSQIF